MNQNQNGNNSTGGSPQTGASFGTKVGYIGTGILIGLVIYPFVRKAVSTVQPKMDKIFDDLTGRAENLAEKTSDWLARAKQSIKDAEKSDEEHMG